MPNNFNHELLLLAREFRGYSQVEVAERAMIDQGHYSRIERGLLNAPISEPSINALSKALNFPVSFFLQRDELSGLPLSVHEPAWRKQSTLKASELRKLRAELNLRIMHLRRYMQAVEFEPDRPLPRYDTDEVGGPAKAAGLLRRAWLVPPGPVKNLTDLCERAGILVVRAKLPAKVDGVTMRLRDVPPIIFLNEDAPPDRMRHSLSHELGHLVMHAMPSENMEEEADIFAGEFLAPIEELRRDLIGGKITLDRLVRLKRYWRVSVASLVYRARRYEYLLQYQSDYLWRQISLLGWRKREPDETQFEPEITRLYDHILSLHEKGLGYTLNDIAAMLHFSPNDVRNLYGFHGRDGNRPRLSVVK